VTVARLPAATRESVPEAQRDVFDEMVKGLGSVPRYGPGSVMIHVPKAHRWATGLNHYLRDESSLPKKVQELAMLVTARELDCQHIWNAHAASARKAGVPNALVDALRDRKELPTLAADEAAVVHFGREFFRTHRVSRGAFQAALEQFGRQGVVELGLTLGNYSLLALMINSFDSDLPPDRTEPLLPV
jgi:4-carboxymuconolactone decarboxylase